MRTQKPTVFIASSSEGRPYADAVFSELEEDTIPTVWDQDAFRPTRGTLEELERIAHEYDFAVLLLTPDDIQVKRGTRAIAPRDNLIAELGLFIGSLGRRRVYYITPKRHGTPDARKFSLPTDFLGVTSLEYDPSREDNRRAAVRTACGTIREMVKQVGKINAESPHISAAGRLGDLSRERAGELFIQTISDAGLVSIEDRGTVQTPPDAFLSLGRRELLITGVTAQDTFSQCSDTIHEALKKRVRVYVVILHPKSPDIERLREHELVDLQGAISQVRARIKEEFEDHPLFQIRYFTRMPPFTAVMIDGDVTIPNKIPVDENGQIRLQPAAGYLTQHSGVILQFQSMRRSKRSGSTPFDFFAEDLRNQWRLARRHPG
jgi:hypothetical protein